MKTNRRSKRVKKTRRNRRSRRTQRGGGQNSYYNTRCKKDCISEHTHLTPGARPEPGFDQQGYNNCIKQCDTIYLPLKHEDVENATLNGWYIYSVDIGDNNVELYLTHKTIKLLPTPSYKITKEIDEKLDELPDPSKKYITKGIFNKKEWKLIYNAETQLLEWENQKDKTKQPFVIQSPLKIGDKTATEST